MSLILRLPHAADPQAWEEFVATYETFLYRYARRRGLDDAAALDVVQLVLMNVHRAVQRWRPEESGPRFRAWLFSIARNEVFDMQAQIGRHARGSGGSAAWETLQNTTARESGDVKHQELLAYRREVILFAASRIKNHVDATTWEAFWRTAVDGEPCDEVAAALGIKIGSVYAARSRVTSRLRDQVQLMTGCDDDL